MPEPLQNASDDDKLWGLTHYGHAIIESSDHLEYAHKTLWAALHESEPEKRLAALRKAHEAAHRAEKSLRHAINHVKR